ncbi:SDR family oxidoreductase [Nocardia uniformis]|uniref:SDR family oxidoreductase n=1 Tax=Nocardia uniformis TaxID=53432 RepID=A0A849C124_9NOCA|nr:SDR family oxidoreductase [Nocardia uniformis]NNH71166.1 SDR family oxidoreductase [Nocardia uniformis]
MSEILVTGGTGALGRHIVDRLREQGHKVRVLSRRAGAGTHTGDLSTGAGVAEAVAGVDAVVHAASDFRKFGGPDLTQTEQLLRASGGVAHLLYVSIVGIEKFPFRYYRNKLACERMVVNSGVPHTILRATQFHELIASALRSVERLPVAPLPTDFRFQPVATPDVARRIAELVASEPLGRASDFGGPEVLTLAELAQTWRAARQRPRRVVRIPLPGRIARAYRAGENTCPDHTDGVLTWAEYVASNPANAYTITGTPPPP